MNPFYGVGRVMDLGDITSSEEVAKRLPGGRLVKAFNTMGWNTLASGSRPGYEDRLGGFIGGGAGGAEATVGEVDDGIGVAENDTGLARDRGDRQPPGGPN